MQLMTSSISTVSSIDISWHPVVPSTAYLASIVCPPTYRMEKVETHFVYVVQILRPRSATCHYACTQASWREVDAEEWDPPAYTYVYACQHGPPARSIFPVDRTSRR